METFSKAHVIEYGLLKKFGGPFRLSRAVVAGAWIGAAACHGIGRHVADVFFQAVRLLVYILRLVVQLHIGFGGFWVGKRPVVVFIRVVHTKWF